MNKGIYAQFINEKDRATIESLKASLTAMMEFVVEIDDGVSMMVDYIYGNSQVTKGEAKIVAKEVKNRLNRFKAFLEE